MEEMISEFNKCFVTCLRILEKYHNYTTDNQQSSYDFFNLEKLNNNNVNRFKDIKHATSGNSLKDTSLKYFLFTH